VIFQAENSNRRLQRDLANLRAWVGEKDWSKVDDNLLIHSLETDEDGDLCLEQRASEMSDIVSGFAADVVCFDPLKDFSLRDLNSDSDMQAITAQIRNVAKRGNPKRAIVVLHHSLTGKQGAAKAIGYDRSSFGRNSKVLFNWTRGQINVAPGSKDDPRLLVMSCGKSSNGEQFKPFAVRLTDSGIYEVEASFDFESWEGEVSGAVSKSRPCAPDAVIEAVGSDSLSKAELVRRIMAETGCGKSAAYDAVDKAVTHRRIHFSKIEKTYAKR
jgi:hypothetical protein